MVFFILGVVLSFAIGFFIGLTICNKLFVKFTMAFASSLLFLQFSYSLQFLIFLLFVIILTNASVVDFKTRIIPFSNSIALVVLGLLTSPLNSYLGQNYLERFANSIYGLFCGGSVLFILGYIGKLLYKKEVMGGGDIKIMFGIGAFIGATKVVFVIFLSTLFATIAGAILMLFYGKISLKSYIPFCPFLSLSSFVSLFVKTTSFFV
ncbi:MAG: A24 family peptidase [Elusimicrobiota bacterium]|jgi:leader peptidase (prepilin peptidase)/N-methyltransferase|nr:A24 family peptidase [Elusimicrobiota bacterium]